MKAVIIVDAGPGGSLKYTERRVPTPKDQEVLIQVKAAGINRPDIAQRKGYYPAPAGADVDIPGLEIAGIVADCGRMVGRWKKGDKICALVSGGGYAEFAVAHESHCLPVPDNLTFAEAASLPETVFTVWHNVFQRAQLRKGEHFLVQGGSSGIGIAAIQLAKAFDAKVFTTAGTAEKCAKCLALGADLCINYREQDFEKELESQGIDVILDMIGAEYFERHIRLLRFDGRLVFINGMKGITTEINIMTIMQKRLTLTGSTLRSRDIAFKAALTTQVEQYVWPLLKSGKFKPVIYQSFSLQEADEAQKLMESSKHIGKLILLIN